MPLVTVVIPTRNRAPLLREAIESVFAVERDDFDLEVIIVDDGSTDDTASVVRAYPVVHVTALGIGASAARNVGINSARGEFIAFLDDDDVWLPNNVSPQLRAFSEHPEYGAVFARVQLTDANRVPFGDPLPSGILTSGWIFDDLLTYWTQLGCVVVRTSVAREVGGFDPELISEEDWDWLLRIAQRYPIGRIKEPVILFRQRGHEDDQLQWQRMPDTLKVFRRHTRRCSPGRRLRLQRVMWKYRGWYAAHFIMSARYYAARSKYSQALRCMAYAVRASPPHAIFQMAQAWRRESDQA